MRRLRSHTLLLAFLLLLLVGAIGIGVLAKVRSELRADLERIQFQSSEQTLLAEQAHVEHLRRVRHGLLDDLAWVQKKLSKLRQHPVLAESERLPDPGTENRIDFKVALFNARHRVLDQAKRKNIYVPESLGIVDTIDEDEKTEIRLWQLASTVLLVETALSFGMDEIVSIDPLEPVIVAVPEHALRYDEYPVVLRFRCHFEDWVQWQAYLDAEQVPVAIRSFSIRNSSLATEPELDIEVIYSGARLWEEEEMPQEPLETQGTSS